MDLMSSYNFLDKLIPYVKYEGGNLSSLEWTLTLMVRCVLLTLVIPW
jgi:hypothetical protein